MLALLDILCTMIDKWNLTDSHARRPCMNMKQPFLARISERDFLPLFVRQSFLNISPTLIDRLRIFGLDLKSRTNFRRPKPTTEFNYPRQTDIFLKAHPTRKSAGSRPVF